MRTAQPGILLPPPRYARYLTFRLAPDADPRPGLETLAIMSDGESNVVGIGLSLVNAIGATIPGLRTFPTYVTKGLEIPSTPRALWVWTRGDDRGELFHRGRAIISAVAPAYILEEAVDAFQYLDSRDLSGFEDGTENPKAEAAVEAAIVPESAGKLADSSFVAVQQWVHDFSRLEAMTPEQQYDAVGRHKITNEELEDAPASAHVKRTAQESFQPAAFVVRRSMPWSNGTQAGLVFVAFGHSLDAYEAQLRRMVGSEDGIVDGLFGFTRPITGAFYWCPPVNEGMLDLRALR